MAGAPGFEPGITGPKPVALPLGYAPKLERCWCRPQRILPAVAEEHDQRDDGDDTDGDQRKRSDEDDQDRNERDERLRDGGDPRGVAHDHRTQPRRDCEIADDDQNGNEQRAPPVDHAENEQDRLDDGNPECNPRAIVAQPAAGSRRAVLKRRLLDHRALKLPAGCGDPGPSAALERRVRGERVFLLSEEAVNRRAGARDVCPKGAVAAQLVGQWRRGKVVRRKRAEIAEGKGPQQSCAPLAEALIAGEGVVDRAGGPFVLALREQEQDPVVLWQVERAELGAVPFAELRPGGEEEGDIGAESGGQFPERTAVQRPAQGPVREPERGRGVGAPSAEAGRDRNLLVDRDVPIRGRARGGGELLERSTHDRVLGEAFDSKLVRRLERDPVGQGDPLEHGRDLVPSVGPGRADDEREVELRGCEELGHRSAAARRTNSSGSSSSARASVLQPIDSSASSARWRSVRPASSREFGSRFRRWAKAASTTRFSSGHAIGGGLGRRRKATSAESTFGGGRKTVRETRWKPVRSAASWTSTETAP